MLFDTTSRSIHIERWQFHGPQRHRSARSFIGLTYAAAFSKRLRLATGICLVAEHNPLVLAKVIASVDSLSSGRFALGVGIGWSTEEFAALGIPFERRAQRTCEYLQVMRQLWGEEKSSFNGEFVRFDGVRSFPKPAQGAKVPIIFGGESLPALRRVARLGNGWFGVQLNPRQLEEKLTTLRKLMTEAGRDISELEIIISPYENQVTDDELRAYHELGVHEFVPFVRLPRDDREIPCAPSASLANGSNPLLSSARESDELLHPRRATIVADGACSGAKTLKLLQLREFFPVAAVSRPGRCTGVEPEVKTIPS